MKGEALRRAAQGDGYAADLASAFLWALDGTPCDDPSLTDQDADSLFRTLVLDEGWELSDARAAYSEASDIAEAVRR